MIKISKNTFKSYFAVAWREIAVIAAVLFFDLLTKHLISHNMQLYEQKTLIKNFLNFTYTKNTEAAFNFDFGLGKLIGTEGLRIFFIVFVAISTTGFVAALVFFHKQSFLIRLPLALIIGGALGNFYDRIVHKGVRDFIEVEYFGGTLFGQASFPIFNLADSALVIGVILFAVYFIFFDAKFQKKKQQEKADNAAQNADNAETEQSTDNIENTQNETTKNKTAQNETAKSSAKRNVKSSVNTLQAAPGKSKKVDKK